MTDDEDARARVRGKALEAAMDGDPKKAALIKHLADAIDAAAATPDSDQ